MEDNWPTKKYLLFSRTRQNSRVFWLSSVESRSTATFGSVCFSRRYMGPVGEWWGQMTTAYFSFSCSNISSWVIDDAPPVFAVIIMWWIHISEQNSLSYSWTERKWQLMSPGSLQLYSTSVSKLFWQTTKLGLSVCFSLPLPSITRLLTFLLFFSASL